MMDASFESWVVLPWFSHFWYYCYKTHASCIRRRRRHTGTISIMIDILGEYFIKASSLFFLNHSSLIGLNPLISLLAEWIPCGRSDLTQHAFNYGSFSDSTRAEKFRTNSQTICWVYYRQLPDSSEGFHRRRNKNETPNEWKRRHVTKGLVVLAKVRQQAIASCWQPFDHRNESVPFRPRTN